MGAPFRMTLSIAGDKELLRAFEVLPRQLQNKIGRNAVNKANAVILPAVQSRVPERKEPMTEEQRARRHLAELIDVERAKTKRGVIKGRVVLPERSALGIKEWPIEPYYWPIALEYGHAALGSGTYAGASLLRSQGRRPVRVRKTAPKHVPPHSFLRAGYDAVETEAASIVDREISDGLHKEWSKRTLTETAPI